MKKGLWIVLFLAIVMTSCGEPTELRGGDFATLQRCMAVLGKELGGELKIVIDNPEKVTGKQPDGTFWACVKKSTGTKGTYWDGYYEIKK